MHPEDIPKTALITPFGLFEWVKMPFGLKSPSQTFQRHIDTVLRPLNHFCIGYVDDILIYSQNSSQHARHVAEVIRHLEYAGLKINFKKCEFNRNEISFLEFRISSGKIKPIPERVKAIQDLKKPENEKNLRQFLGSLAFYHKFIKGLSDLLSPLYDLQSKISRNKNNWNWDSKHQKAFSEAKERLANSVPPEIPKFGKAYGISNECLRNCCGDSLTSRRETSRIFL